MSVESQSAESNPQTDGQSKVARPTDVVPEVDPAPLKTIGWSPELEQTFASDAPPGTVPGRVARIDGPSALVLLEGDSTRAEQSRALEDAVDLESQLGVGDWVAVERRARHETDAIVFILPRWSALIRRRAARRESEAAEGQVLAANVDTVFIVVPAPQPNLRRIEREVAQIYESGAQPVVVLTKSDLVADAQAAAQAVAEVSPSVPIHVTNGLTGVGVEQLGAYAAGQRTVVFLGASGVGKSTLANRLLGAEVLATREVRSSDGKGRHTTTARHLIPLPNGGALIDTPGLRSFALYEATDGLAQTFADVESIAEVCRFRDCGHTSEPSCAVLAAVEAGTLSMSRLEAYRALERELAYELTKVDKQAEMEKRDERKRFGRSIRKGAKKRRRLKEGG